MVFEKMRIRDIHLVVRYNTDLKRWRAHDRKDHIMGIKIGGEAIHDFGYQKFNIVDRSIYFLNMRDDYDVEVLEPGEAFSVHFTTDEEIDTDSFCIPIEYPDEILSLLKKAEAARRSSSDDDLSLMTAVYALSAEISRIRKKAYSHTDTRIQRAKRYMDEHFRDSDCLARATAECGISSRRFNDLFRAAYDTTPNRYLIARTVEYAKQILLTDGITVCEAARLCGFSDVYYFSKLFKKETGISPSRWAKMA